MPYKTSGRAPPLERSITNSICRAIERAGGLPIKLHGSIYQQAGLPDLLVIIPAELIRSIPGSHGARVWFIEVKRPGEKLTARQEAMHKKLRRYGAFVNVSHSTEEAMDFLGLTQALLRRLGHSD